MTFSSIQQDLDDITLECKREEQRKEMKERHKEAISGANGMLSGKKKKQMLQARRERKSKLLETNTTSNTSTNKPTSIICLDDDDDSSIISTSTTNATDLARLMKKPLNLTATLGRSNNSKNSTSDAVDAELSTYFVKETKQQIYLRTVAARAPLDTSKRNANLVACKDYYYQEGGSDLLDFPTRPEWKNSTCKSVLEQNEARVFQYWLDDIHEKYKHEELNHFEHNLQVWRQLWRVIERANVIVIVCDIRNPLLHIPPSLYKFINDDDVPIVLVLNKVDLVPPMVVSEWKEYLTNKYSSASIVQFSSKEQSSTAESSINLLQACGITKDDATSIINSRTTTGTSKKKKSRRRKKDKKYFEVEVEVEVVKPKVKRHHIGLIGQPNVGKSSILNALAGQKLVSVSHTAGHTKRLQSIDISEKVTLLDCPGLVFPSAAIPKSLQEVAGLFPYAQVREPLSAIRLVAEAIPLEKILKLKARVMEFENEVGEMEVVAEEDWTPWSISEAYAEKKKYKTDCRGRPDHHRAGVELIRDVMDGIISFYYYPPSEL